MTRMPAHPVSHRDPMPGALWRRDLSLSIIQIPALYLPDIMESERIWTIRTQSEELETGSPPGQYSVTVVCRSKWMLQLIRANFQCSCYQAGITSVLQLPLRCPWNLLPVGLRCGIIL